MLTDPLSHPHLAKSESSMQGEAGLVLREDPRLKGPDAASLAALHHRRQQGPADPTASRAVCDVHADLGDPTVDRAVADRSQRRPPHHLSAQPGHNPVIGEMGLITKQLRSATIQAEVPSVLYALSADAYERIKRENSALAQALLTYVIQVMAERLSFASKVIGVLRR